MARSNVAIYSALAANVAIAIAKFIAGGISHSSAMVAEGVRLYWPGIGDRVKSRFQRIAYVVIQSD